MSSKSKKRKPQISLTKSVSIAECIFLWAWVTVYTDGYCEGFLESINHKHMEVIGTIHDNPELLEVSHE